MCECTCAYSAWGALPCLCFLLCVDGGGAGWGRTKAAMSRSLAFNDVCGKVCVCFCVCAKEGEVRPWSKPFEVLHIWAGYLERMLCGANTHTDREKERGKDGGMFLLF